MTDNLELFYELFTTNPSAVKKVDGRSYTCFSAQAYWIVIRMTEVFGPNGEGWGVEIKDQGFQSIDDDNMIHWAVVELWYIRNNKRCSSQHMGSTKVKYRSKEKNVIYDQDAPKKTITNAFTKCTSYLGLAGDIHSGMWGDPNHRKDAKNYWDTKEKRKKANDDNWQAVNEHGEYESQNNQSSNTVNNCSLQQILNEIQNTTSYVVLKNIYRKFENTEHALAVSDACIRHAVRKGWSQGKKESNKIVN